MTSGLTKPVERADMARIVFCITVITISISWAFTPDSVADVPPSPQLQSQILKGIELTVLTDFEGAKKIYQGFIKEYPDEPIGYFYMAAVLQSEMLDREDFSSPDACMDFIEKCVQRSKSLQKQRDEDPWLLFYEGNAYLYRSFLKSKLGKWWGAYRDAGKGVNRLEKVLELDSTFYDVYLGIGSYKYWKSAKIKFLTWLPFVADEREAGIEMVRKAIERGEYSKLIGRDQLAWILLDAGRLEEAKKYALENYEAFPESRFFQWTLVEVLFQMHAWEDARRHYGWLLRAEQQLAARNHYNEVECLLKMAEIDFENRNLSRADSLVTELFNIQMAPAVRERARPKLKKALKIKLECAQLSGGQNQPGGKF
jgi:tetratricopeptide (TPR) repeat protein